MPVNVVEIADAIRSQVATGPLAGSRLAGSLKSQFPDWNPADFGVRTLREFVTSLVPGVVVAGRSGMDVVYALEGADVPGPPPPNPVGDFWRIWVSPNSPYAIGVDRSNLAVRAVPRAAEAEPGLLILAPPSPEVHRTIARDFLSKLPPEDRVSLEAAVDSPHEQWWQEWNQALTEPDLAESWNRYRHGAFDACLAEALIAEGLEQPAVETVLETLRRQRASRTTARIKEARGTESQYPGDRDELVRIVTGAVQRMSATELREIKLPLGVVLDMLATHKSR